MTQNGTPLGLIRHWLDYHYDNLRYRLEEHFTESNEEYVYRGATFVMGPPSRMEEVLQIAFEDFKLVFPIKVSSRLENDVWYLAFNLTDDFKTKFNLQEELETPNRCKWCGGEHGELKHD